MRKLCLLVLTTALLTQFAGPAQAWRGGVRIGIGIGVPIGPYYGPYYRPYYPYGYPYPYYGYPGPVVVAPGPVVVQQPPVVVSGPAVPPPGYVPAPAYGTAPAPSGGVAPAVAQDQANIDIYLSRLSQPDENVRRQAVVELGRARVQRAVEPLTSTLANDISPAVRDAAARSLGLIGSPSALAALTHAAQADNNRDVRRSAQYSIEVIRAQMQPR